MVELATLDYLIIELAKQGQHYSRIDKSLNPAETPRNSSKFGQIATYTVKCPSLPHEIKDKEQYTMPAKTLRIATRKSPLALWQAHYVKAALEKAHGDLNVELLAMSTRGDKILDTPLAKVGGQRSLR